MAELYKCKFCNYHAAKEKKLYAHAVSHNPNLALENFKSSFGAYFEPYTPPQPQFSIDRHIIRELGFAGRMPHPENVWDSGLQNPQTSSAHRFDYWNKLIANIKNLSVEDLETPYFTIDEEGTLSYLLSRSNYATLLYYFFSDYILTFGWKLTDHYIKTTRGQLSAKVLTLLLEQCKIMFAVEYLRFEEYLGNELNEFNLTPTPFIPVTFDSLYCYAEIKIAANEPLDSVAVNLAAMLSSFDELTVTDSTLEHREEIRNRINSFLLGLQEKLPNLEMPFFDSFVSAYNNICDELFCQFRFDTKECLAVKDEFYLDWKYIDFFDGSIHLYLPNEYKQPTARPVVVHISKAKRAFNAIKDFIAQNTPSPLVKIEAGKIKRILNVSDLLRGIDVLAQRPEAIIWSTPYKRTRFSAEMSQAEIKERIRTLDVESLNYLCANQLKEFPLYYCPESRNYENSQRDEDAFLFVVKRNNDRIIAVFENTHTNNASYQFILREKNLPKIIELVNKYFSSPTLNKREHYTEFSRMVSPYVIMFKRIPHNGYEWRRRILGHSF